MNKQLIVDPVNCLCKLALLKFYPDDTKLRFSDNIIELQKPSNYLLTGVTRFYYQDKRDDIHLLYQPIAKFITWYIGQSYDDEHFFTKIANNAINGLKKLQETYSKHKNINNVIFTLELFITYLKKYVNGTLNIDELYNSDEILINNGMGDIIKNDINNERLIQISNMLELLNNEYQNKNLNHYIDSINALLEIRDEEFKNIVLQNNTFL